MLHSRVCLVGEALELLLLLVIQSAGHLGEDSRLFCESSIEVGDVKLAGYFGFPRGLDLLGLQFLPVKGGEERMALDGLNVRGTGAKPPLGVTFKKLGNQILHFIRSVDASGEFELFLQDLPVHLICVCGVERRNAKVHFVNDSAKRPPVHLFAISLVAVIAVKLDNFGGKILGCTTNRPGLLVAKDLLAQTKISEVDMSVLADKDIFGLQITVDDTTGVKMAQRKGELGSVKADSLYVDPLFSLNNAEKITTADELQHKMELLFCLESPGQTHNIRVLHLAEDAVLLLCSLHLIALYKHLLVQHLHGIQLLCVLLPDQHDLAEATTAEHLEKSEVIHADLLLLTRWDNEIFVSSSGGSTTSKNALNRLDPGAHIALSLSVKIKVLVADETNGVGLSCLLVRTHHLVPTEIDVVLILVFRTL
mmetsp:Transcript_17384/g.43294  ORF Transcript_17384/g.43294 Transcript_17384/m.43294 type:complete len:422 (+) Transcript_17384:372-1637(+)